jgi:hypothetical protein
MSPLLEEFGFENIFLVVGVRTGANKPLIPLKHTFNSKTSRSYVNNLPAILCAEHDGIGSGGAEQKKPAVLQLFLFMQKFI